MKIQLPIAPKILAIASAAQLSVSGICGVVVTVP